MDNVKEKKSSRNILFWIVAVAIVLVALQGFRILVQNRDLIFGDTSTYSAEEFDSDTMELGPKTKVITTLNNNTYHLRGCPEIMGITEKMNYNAALSKNLNPCNICISDGY